MGQKVNPIGLRVGVNKEWQASWFATKKDFGTLLNKDDKIRKYRGVLLSPNALMVFDAKL